MDLIIYAHPRTGGNCEYILERVKRKLKDDFEVLDLYDMKYDPVLHEEEHYTRGNKKVSKLNLEIQKKIEGCDKIILIYPVWWGTMPAILKGFFDRVFISGFAFKYEGGVPVKLLKEKKAVVFITTGAGKFLARIFDRSAFRNIKKEILGFCGIDCKIYHIGKATRFDEVQKRKIEKIVHNAKI